MTYCLTIYQCIFHLSSGKPLLAIDGNEYRESHLVNGQEIKFCA